MTTQEVKRKLAAILSADVKGYSRLMGEDEIGTIRTLNAYKEVMTSLIQQHHGKVVDAPGDNLLAEFASVVDTVQCAVEIQKELKTQNSELPENRGMEFRIGVNLGDVIEQEGKIFGDGVNIAARLESLSDPGGICISGTAFDQVKNKLPLGYAYLGEQTVKNIADPIRAYRVLMEPEAIGRVIGIKRPRPWQRATIGLVVAVIVVVAAVAIWRLYFRTTPPLEVASEKRMAFPLPDKPSIAVLPFVNMTGDPSQEFFCDGLSEEIITALCKTPKLFVIARTSSFSYKGKPVKVKQVSEELGVRYVLEGSVRKADDRVRITAQLIDALAGQHLWAERYDRGLKDIFAVQDEITKNVISATRVRLTEGELARIFAKGTKNLEAYLKVSEAIWSAFMTTKEGVLRAEQLAEEAIALDPDYPYAYYALGVAHIASVWLGISNSPRESLKRAIELYRKAISLDDSLAVAHAGLGYSLAMVREYDQSIAHGERAMALEPNTAAVLNAYGGILYFVGRREEAIPIFRQALRLNPKAPNYYYRNLGGALRDSGQYDEAIAVAKKAIEREPDDLVAYVILASSYGLAGRMEEANAAANEVLRINPKFSIERFMSIFPLKDPAARESVAEALRKAGLK
jgi:adenylate cyclase